MKKIILGVSLLAVIAVGIISFKSNSAEATYNWPYLLTGSATSTSGTPQMLATTTIPGDVHFLVKAKNTNTGVITIGYTTTTAHHDSTTHFTLYPGESVGLKVSNANLIFFDSSVSAEGLEWITEYDY